MQATCRTDSTVQARWPIGLRCGALLHDREGAAAVEYGLIAALIAITVLIGVYALGGSVDELWTAVGNSMFAAFDNQ